MRFEDAREFALGYLGLTPRQFYNLTPAEFRMMRHGWQRRTNRMLELWASLVSHIATPHVKSHDRHALAPSSILSRVGLYKKGV